MAGMLLFAVEVLFLLSDRKGLFNCLSVTSSLSSCETGAPPPAPPPSRLLPLSLSVLLAACRRRRVLYRKTVGGANGVLTSIQGFSLFLVVFLDERSGLGLAAAPPSRSAEGKVGCFSFRSSLFPLEFDQTTPAAGSQDGEGQAFDPQIIKDLRCPAPSSGSRRRCRFLSAAQLQTHHFLSDAKRRMQGCQIPEGNMQHSCQCCRRRGGRQAWCRSRGRGRGRGGL